MINFKIKDQNTLPKYIFEIVFKLKYYNCMIETPTMASYFIWLWNYLQVEIGWVGLFYLCLWLWLWMLISRLFSTCDCVCGCLFLGYCGAWMETGGWKLMSNHQDMKIYGCYTHCIDFSLLLCLAWHLGMLFCIGRAYAC